MKINIHTEIIDEYDPNFGWRIYITIKGFTLKFVLSLIAMFYENTDFYDVILWFRFKNGEKIENFINIVFYDKNNFTLFGYSS